MQEKRNEKQTKPRAFMKHKMVSKGIAYYNLNNRKKEWNKKYLK